MYYYNLNNKLAEKWYRSKVIKYSKMKEFNKNYTSFHTIIQPEYNPDGKHIGHYPIIRNGGWHFSYFGGIETIKNKLLNFSHSEFAYIAKDTDEMFLDKIKDSKDILNRENLQIDYIKLEDNVYLPTNYKMLL